MSGNKISNQISSVALAIGLPFLAAATACAGKEIKPGLPANTNNVTAVSNRDYVDTIVDRKFGQEACNMKAKVAPDSVSRKDHDKELQIIQKFLDRNDPGKIALEGNAKTALQAARQAYLYIDEGVRNRGNDDKRSQYFKLATVSSRIARKRWEDVRKSRHYMEDSRNDTLWSDAEQAIDKAEEQSWEAWRELETPRDLAVRKNLERVLPLESQDLREKERKAALSLEIVEELLLSYFSDEPEYRAWQSRRYSRMLGNPAWAAVYDNKESTDAPKNKMQAAVNKALRESGDFMDVLEKEVGGPYDPHTQRFQAWFKAMYEAASLNYMHENPGSQKSRDRTLADAGITVKKFDRWKRKSWPQVFSKTDKPEIGSP